jgi:spore germination protein GerM
MTGQQANALTVVGLAGLLAAVAFTAPRWAALLRERSVPVEGEEAASEPPARNEAEVAAAEAARRISVRLYFDAPDQDGLLAEEREVAFSSDLARQVRIVVEELAKGPQTELLATLPEKTRVLDVFVLARGVAYVNLSAEAASGMPGGSTAELHSVYSVVNTVVTNFPAVRRVQILVDDRPVTSLGGHVDLSRPLPPDMTLVALSPPPTTTTPTAEASPRAPGVLEAKVVR